MKSLRAFSTSLLFTLLISGISTALIADAVLLDIDRLSIRAAPFGKVGENVVKLYTLENAAGMQVSITNYGATVSSIIMPDAKGNLANIAAGFDTLEGYFSEEYKANSPYFGGIIGRYASAIEDSQFSLNGKDYTLADNMAPHHLHGGKLGFDRLIWQHVSSKKRADAVSLTLNLVSKDGDEGYPGTLNLYVQYTLTNNNELRIHYMASSDKDTPLSLTNHTYFNLTGYKENILSHELSLKSQGYLVPSDSGVTHGVVKSVKGESTDFNKAKTFGELFKDMPMGLEHFYIFDNPKAALQKVAKIVEPKSGRTLEILTTEPGTLVYTGRYTSDKLKREDGTQYGQFRGFCIETSKYPNGPNIKGSPRSILKAGEAYDETTVFKFSW